MRRQFIRGLALWLLVLTLGFGVASCGKKNEPDPPDGPTKATGVRPYPRS